MDTKWLVPLMALLLAGCSSPLTYKAVVHAYLEPTDMSAAAAIEDITAFMHTRGYRLDSKIDSKSNGRASVLLNYSNGSTTLVSFDNASDPNCFNFDVFIPEQSGDYSGARSISDAFVANFRHSQGWHVTENDSCRIAP